MPSICHPYKQKNIYYIAKKIVSELSEELKWWGDGYGLVADVVRSE
jgi:hypothetical protein